MTRTEAIKYFEYKDGFLYWKIARSTQTSPGDRAGTRQANHWRVAFAGKTYRLERLVWLREHGILPAKLGFKNGDPHDCRLENLEIRS